MDLVRREVDGASEHVLDARIDALAAQIAQVGVQTIGVLAPELGHAAEAEVHQIPLDAGPHSGNRLKIRV